LCGVRSRKRYVLLVRYLDNPPKPSIIGISSSYTRTANPDHYNANVFPLRLGLGRQCTQHFNRMHHYLLTNFPSTKPFHLQWSLEHVTHSPAFKAYKGSLSYFKIFGWGTSVSSFSWGHLHC